MRVAIGKPFVNGLVALLALSAIGLALLKLTAGTAGLLVEKVDIAGTPATVFRPANGKPAPALVIAHGFAGSRELMQPFAITFARNGYVAITFDFLGHGKNAQPLHGSITDADGATRALVDQLGAVVAFAKTAPGADGKVALLGHSMASDIVVRYARAHSDVAATIAVSMFAPNLTPTSPRDLLVIVGAYEPKFLRDQGIETTAMAAQGRVEPRTTYGSLGEGTGRRVSFSDDVEHIGVLYSRDSQREALNWVDAVFDHRGSGYLEVRGRWLGLLFFGLVLLARPFLGLLPAVAERRLGAGLPWRRLLPAALAPAILTPLILWKAPTTFLPLLLGDYLAAHFLVYGVLTWVGLWLVQRGEPRTRPLEPISIGRFGLGITVLAVYSIVFFGLPIDLFVASFWPIPARVPLVLAMMVGTLPYFTADEWLTRGATAPRGAYAFTKLCFILSLGLAVALNLERLFFLIIIAAVIVLFFGRIRAVQRLDLSRHPPPVRRWSLERARIRLGHRGNLSPRRHVIADTVLDIWIRSSRYDDARRQNTEWSPRSARASPLIRRA